MTIRVLLVDEHSVVREGWRRLFERTNDILAIAETGSGEDACGLYDLYELELAIVDLNLPGISGFETVRRITARDPEARLLVSSTYDDASLASRALQAGARGYVSKASAPEVLVEAVRAVGGGKQYISHDMAQRLALQAIPGQKAAIDSLSPREFEIFHLLAEGKSVTHIAATLLLSQKTVANYQSVIRQKLETESSAQMVWMALRRNMLGGHKS